MPTGKKIEKQNEERAKIEQPIKPVEFNLRNWRNLDDYLEAVEEYKMKLQAYFIIYYLEVLNEK